MNSIITDPTLRHDFLYLFDCKNGNPNGDPSTGNMPRQDIETGQGYVTDACQKRQIRDYIVAKYNLDIFMQSQSVLNEKIAQVVSDLGLDKFLDRNDKEEAEEIVLNDDLEVVDPSKTTKTKKSKGNNGDRKSLSKPEHVAQAGLEMCARYWDIRTFGAVMSTGYNAGQVRGPIQLTFARSLDAITIEEFVITRCCVANATEGKDNKTMGTKYLIPYGLYKSEGFFNPAFAAKTGFTGQDLECFWDALQNCWELSRSASRGTCTSRKIVIFTHKNKWGNHQAAKLFDLVKICKSVDKPASFGDYSIDLSAIESVPNITVTVLE